jgi:hypothetical protein
MDQNRANPVPYSKRTEIFRNVDDRVVVQTRQATSGNMMKRNFVGDHRMIVPGKQARDRKHNALRRRNRMKYNPRHPEK